MSSSAELIAKLQVAADQRIDEPSLQILETFATERDARRVLAVSAKASGSVWRSVISLAVLVSYLVRPTRAASMHCGIHSPVRTRRTINSDRGHARQGKQTCEDFGRQRVDRQGVARTRDCDWAACGGARSSRHCVRLGAAVGDFRRQLAAEGGGWARHKHLDGLADDWFFRYKFVSSPHVLNSKFLPNHVMEATMTPLITWDLPTKQVTQELNAVEKMEYTIGALGRALCSQAASMNNIRRMTSGFAKLKVKHELCEGKINSLQEEHSAFQGLKLKATEMEGEIGKAKRKAQSIMATEVDDEELDELALLLDPRN
ncbi:RNA-binding (RRM/RBD/RNP motifs) family protein [Striga asiatica]|uniref:RNA-binding (RRM/RBD/RNP motifs) family protein n=1 Tax=Striga asiatica TaxID=4170 RepID=A0A5A7PEI1_STRAF|nr:RNA-binding (RRM/RBD/RNP motifs) family protein [Striga asiatica]